MAETIIDKNKEFLTMLYKMGFISPTVFEQNEIFKFRNEVRSTKKTAEHFSVSEKHVWSIMKKFNALPV